MGIAKSPNNTICTSIKIVNFCQIRKAQLNIWTCHAHFNFEIQMPINPLILQLETSAFRFKQLTYRVKDVVFTSKLLDQPFSHNLRKTDFSLRNSAQVCLIQVKIRQTWAGFLSKKSVFHKLRKSSWSDSLDVKTTSFTL